MHVLPGDLANKIAAGEVVDRPASVVKELVENSLDAGATRIAVRVVGGGRTAIFVDDDGEGMTPRDALLCLARHATSKIRDVEDLFAIGTLGFRGEALPSIASVSKLSLVTAPRGGAGSGTRIICDGGAVVSNSPAACNPGTSIAVEQLFFNVPARKKFLKAPDT
ncbi:MAG: DNA mismatch repair endonuclease MutL, partial [Acidobacteriota bacterium]